MKTKSGRNSTHMNKKNHFPDSDDEDFIKDTKKSTGKDSVYSSTAFSKPNANLDKSNESQEELEIIKVDEDNEEIILPSHNPKEE